MNELSSADKGIDHIESNWRNAYLFVGVLIIVSTLLSSCAEIAIFLVPVILSVPFIAFYFSYRATRHIRKGQYKKAVPALPLIGILVFFIGFPFYVDGYSDFIAQYLKLSLEEKEYLEAVSKTQPDAKGHRYKEFEWGGFMMNPVKLVYDESDELNVESRKRSKDWWKRAQRSEFAYCRSNSKHLKGHFYVVEFSC